MLASVSTDLGNSEHSREGATIPPSPSLRRDAFSGTATLREFLTLSPEELRGRISEVEVSFKGLAVACLATNGGYKLVCTGVQVSNQS